MWRRVLIYNPQRRWVSAASATSVVVVNECTNGGWLCKMTMYGISMIICIVFENAILVVLCVFAYHKKLCALHFHFRPLLLSVLVYRSPLVFVLLQWKPVYQSAVFFVLVVCCMLLQGNQPTRDKSGRTSPSSRQWRSMVTIIRCFAAPTLYIASQCLDASMTPPQIEVQLDTKLFFNKTN